MPGSIVVLGLASVLLQGCVAAIVPVAASGMIARHHRRSLASATSTPVVASAPAATASTPAPGTPPSAPVMPPPVPARLDEMKPGVVYTGAFPTAASAPAEPRLADPAPPDATAPVVSSAPGSSRNDWRDLVRYVAGNYTDPSPRSALLERGTTLAAPRWVPCSAKPPAVLVDLGSVLTPRGAMPARVADVLGGLEALQVTAVYTTRLTGPALAAALRSFAGRDVRAPQPGRTLFPIVPGREPAVRARIGASFCVVAIASGVVPDFPGQSSDTVDRSGWPRSWFYVPAQPQG